MRDFLLIGGMVVVAIVVGGLLFVFGPTSLQADMQSALRSSGVTTSGPVAYTVLAQGDALSVPGQNNYRIRSTEDFQSLWTMIYGARNPPPLPTVDFTNYEVLAVFDGSHADSGHQISIFSLTDANAQRTLIVTHVSPGASCPTAPFPSSPFVLIQVPKTTFPLTHTDVEQVTTCS